MRITNPRLSSSGRPPLDAERLFPLNNCVCCCLMSCIETHPLRGSELAGKRARNFVCTKSRIWAVATDHTSQNAFRNAQIALTWWNTCLPNSPETLSSKKGPRFFKFFIFLFFNPDNMDVVISVSLFSISVFCVDYFPPALTTHSFCFSWNPFSWEKFRPDTQHFQQPHIPNRSLQMHYLN